MDLIDRVAILAEAKRISGPMTGDGWDNWGVYALIERQPTIEAVPLDALCEWLSEKCRMTIGGVHCRFPKETWKQILTEWMEGQHDHN